MSYKMSFLFLCQESFNYNILLDYVALYMLTDPRVSSYLSAEYWLENCCDHRLSEVLHEKHIQNGDINS